MELISIEEIERLSPLLRRPLAKGLMRIFSIDRLNDLYQRNEQFRGAAFARAVLCDLDVTYAIGFAGKSGEESRGNPLERIAGMLPEGPFITVSNHPYGSIDGIILADLMGHLRPGYKLLVNKILERIEALSEMFISVTPTGPERTAPTHESIAGIKQALVHLHEGSGLGLFPSGAVSNLSLRDFSLHDRPWQEPVLRLIAKVRVPILPIRFFDGNSLFFYLLGLVDWRVRMSRLPAEVLNKRGHIARLGIGSLISPEAQRRFLAAHTLQEFGNFLRNSVYGMSLPSPLLPLSLAQSKVSLN